MNATPTPPSDAEALAFLKRYHRAIRYGIHLEGVYGAAADDVYQEVSLHLVECFRRRPERPEHTLSFAVQVGRNKAMDHRARSQRRATAPLPAEAVDPTPNALDLITKLEAHQRLRACVELLSVMRREVMRRRLAGHTYAAIAYDLNLTVGGAKVLAHRATLDLRRMLTDTRYS